MLGVGIDWAEEFHVVCLGRTGQGIIETLRIDHRPSAVDRLVARIVALEPDPVALARFPFGRVDGRRDDQQGQCAQRRV